MKCYVDRIEDSKYAVIYAVEGGGEMVIPADQFGFEIREGMHLDVSFTPDADSEKSSLERIKKLQEGLLKNNRKTK